MFHRVCLGCAVLLDGRLRLRCPSHIRRELAFANLGSLVAPSGRVADLVCSVAPSGSRILHTWSPRELERGSCFLGRTLGSSMAFRISVSGAPLGVWAVSLPASGGRAGSPSLLRFPCSGVAAGVGFLPWHRGIAGNYRVQGSGLVLGIDTVRRSWGGPISIRGDSFAC